MRKRITISINFVLYLSTLFPRIMSLFLEAQGVVQGVGRLGRGGIEEGFPASGYIAISPLQKYPPSGLSIVANPEPN